MKKNKEWLEEEVINLYPSHSEMYEHPDYLTVEKVDLINNFIDLIDQLDEPEKVVIPQFVADYYELYKDDGLIFEEWFGFPLPKDLEDDPQGDDVFKWLLDNDNDINLERQFILADIIAHGLGNYEVEREKKYRVIFMREPEFERITYLARDKNGCCFINSDSENNPRGIAFLEEAEIEAIDERYMAFAAEVTE